MESNAGELVNRGVDCWEGGNLDQAIALYTEAIAIEPTFSEAYYNRGTAYGEKGNYDAAIGDYTAALELKPRYASLADIYYNRANAWGKKGKYIRAIVDYSQAIRNNPQYYKAYYNRGLALLRAHIDYEGAISDFSQAIVLNPYCSEAFNNRGAVYTYKGEFSQAIPDFIRAAELNPTDPAPSHNLEVARANKERGNLDADGEIVLMQI